MTHRKKLIEVASPEESAERVARFKVDALALAGHVSEQEPGLADLELDSGGNACGVGGVVVDPVGTVPETPYGRSDDVCPGGLHRLVGNRLGACEATMARLQCAPRTS